MIIERLSQEHRNIEKLLAILERELEVFDRGDRPDYEVIRAVISYFKVYPEVYHHPQEDLVFAKLRERDPVAAAKVGDLARVTPSSRTMAKVQNCWPAMSKPTENSLN
jgi:hemerythrin-like domain-containing protein